MEGLTREYFEMIEGIYDIHLGVADKFLLRNRMSSVIISEDEDPVNFRYCIDSDLNRFGYESEFLDRFKKKCDKRDTEIFEGWMNGDY